MNKFIYILFLINFLFNCSSSFHEVIDAKERPKVVLTGSWQYDLFANGKRMGSSLLSVKKIKNQLVSYYEISINFGDTVIISKESIVESLKFEPVKYSYINTVIQNKKVNRKKLTATFKDKKVFISDNFGKRDVTFDKNFILSNSRLFSAIHYRNNYKIGSTIKTFVFDPSIEEDKLIPVSEEIVGKEIFNVNNQKKALIHIKQAVGSIKDVNNFVDEKGVLYLSRFSALNTNFVLKLK